MRPATYYYLAQAWPRPTRPRSLRRAAYRGRHAAAPASRRPGRELPAVARRVLAALSGTSQPA